MLIHYRKTALILFAGLLLVTGLTIIGCEEQEQVATTVEEPTRLSTMSDSAKTTDEFGENGTSTNNNEEEETLISDTESEKNQDMAATLLYQGHASIRIVTAEGKVIYIDPFSGNGYELPADLILMTHRHSDHTKDSLITQRNEGCTVITWADAHQNSEYQNYDLRYVYIETVEAGYNQNHDVSECVGFILTFSNGIKAYFSGDTSTTPSMKEFAEKELDYAFLCCDGVYNMDAAEASECARMINAKHTIPYHMEPVKDKSGFDISVAETFDGPGKIILQPGEELVLK